MKKIISLLGLMVFFSLSSLFAQSSSANAEGGFVSLGLYPLATLTTDRASGRHNSGGSASDGGIGSSLKFGYQFQNARAYYSLPSFRTDDLTYNFTILGGDYINDNGFIVGYGIGSGKVDLDGRTCSSCSGTATAFNIGWHSGKEKQNIVFSILLSSMTFSYDAKNTVRSSYGSQTETVKVTAGAAGLALEVGYLF